MSFVSHLFARAVPCLIREFLEVPGLGERLYRFGENPHFLTPPEGLLVVREVDCWCLALEGDEEYKQPLPPAWPADPHLEATWSASRVTRLLKPDARAIGFLRDCAWRTGQALAIYCNHERGDILYDQYAWVFDPRAEQELPDEDIFEFLYVFRDERRFQRLVGDGRAPLRALNRNRGLYPLGSLLRHLGVHTSLAFFAPDEDPGAWDLAERLSG